MTRITLKLDGKVVSTCDVDPAEPRVTAVLTSFLGKLLTIEVEHDVDG